MFHITFFYSSANLEEPLLEIPRVGQIEVGQGVVRCENWPRYIHDVSIVITQIKSRHIFAHRQHCRDIAGMPTAARYERTIMPGSHRVTVTKHGFLVCCLQSYRVRYSINVIYRDNVTL